MCVALHLKSTSFNDVLLPSCRALTQPAHRSFAWLYHVGHPKAALIRLDVRITDLLHRFTAGRLAERTLARRWPRCVHHGR